MEQIQRRFIKFHVDTLAIKEIGQEIHEEAGYAVLPVEFKLVAPFFDLSKRLNEYYPLIIGDTITGFRRKELFESQIVLNTEDQTVKSLRSDENFIANARIAVHQEDGLRLFYDPNFFDEISNREHLDRLSLAKDRVYNLYVTCKGDPFTIYCNYEITLNPFLEDGLRLPYDGPKDLSVYVIAKD